MTNFTVKIIFWTVIIVIASSAAFALDIVMNEGDETEVEVENSNYSITALVITPVDAMFRHNGEESRPLEGGGIKIGGNYTFSDNLNIYLERIMYYSIYKKAQITLSIIKTCGDGACSQGETCTADSCCSGNRVNLNSDSGNCGSCGNACSIICLQGSCTSPAPSSYCGDGICNPDENCGDCNEDCKCASNKRCENNDCKLYCGNDKCDMDEDYRTCPIDCKKASICGDDVCQEEYESKNCCADCGCEAEYDCVRNKCMLADKCSSNEECSDNNSCTTDICSGIPKICNNPENQSCIIRNASDIPIENNTVPELMNDDLNKSKIVNNSENQQRNSIFNGIISWLKSFFNK